MNKNKNELIFCQYYCAVIDGKVESSENYNHIFNVMHDLALKNNVPRALNELAICYVLGRGVKQDKDKAFCLYEKAAKKAHAVAQCSLGLLYAFVKTRDKDKAFYWYKKSAAKYNIEAMFSLGCLYFEGKGTRKNVKKAIDLWK